MALLASVFALAGRFLGRIVSTALTWASTLLFGRVAPNRQLLLGGVTIGSLVWAVVMLGIGLPRIGAFLLAAVTLPDWIPDWTIRAAMLAAAALLPLAIGNASRFLLEPATRPHGWGIVGGILRGYPLALVLAAVLVYAMFVAVFRKARTLVLRWGDSHIPVVVMPGGYAQVVADLEAALAESGIAAERRAAPLALEVPTRLVGLVAGPGVRSLLPERLQQLNAERMEVLVYPSDIAISGRQPQLARARAAIATRLTFTRAYLTSDPKTQEIEDRLAAIGVHDGIASRRPPHPNGLTAADREILADVDRRLSTVQAPYDQWEVVYRIRLQVERDLLRSADAAAAAAGPVAAAEASASGAPVSGPRPSAEPARAVPRPNPVAALSAIGALSLIALDAVLTVAEGVLPRLPRRGGSS